MFSTIDFKKSAREIIGDAADEYYFNLRYSNKFSSYGGNIRKSGKQLELRLSRDWMKIDNQIVEGFAQELIIKILRKKHKETSSIRLYNIFVKNLHKGIKKTIQVPELAEVFTRINEEYFYGLVEMPNLDWSNFSRTKMGSYDFKTDTIKINPALREHPKLLDYVMYHEILHKKHKFDRNGSRTSYHHRKFRKDEKSFPNAEKLEKELQNLNIRMKRKKKSFLSRFFS